jgi:tetratricopeptide (TPR) repeat protein
MSLHSIGLVAYQEGDYAAAQSLQEQSLAIRRALGDQRGIAMALGNLGNTVSELGDRGRARALQEESLAIRRALGDKRGVALSLADLGSVCRRQGDRAEAQALYRESLATGRPLGDRLCIAAALEGLAATLDEPLRASCLWGHAQRLREEIHAPVPHGQRAAHDAIVAKARAASSTVVTFERAWQNGRALTTDEVIAAALVRDEDLENGHPATE